MGNWGGEKEKLGGKMKKKWLIREMGNKWQNGKVKGGKKEKNKSNKLPNSMIPV